MSTTEQAAHDIKQRISELSDLGEEDLTGAMADLKRALMENPAACSILLPEDVGQLVAALRRITKQEVFSATTKSKTPKKPKTLTKEEIDAAWDEL